MTDEMGHLVNRVLPEDSGCRSPKHFPAVAPTCNSHAKYLCAETLIPNWTQPRDAESRQSKMKPYCHILYKNNILRNRSARSRAVTLF